MVISGMKLMKLDITHTYGDHYFYEEKRGQVLYKIENKKINLLQLLNTRYKNFY